MSEALIALEDLSIGYDNEPVLSGISCSIDVSSFTAILGANGSGKSTLLKTLLGLQAPLSGHIRVSRAGNTPLVFGYVPQAVQLDVLYPLTGFEVALMGAYGRVGPGCRMSRAERSFVKECLRATAADDFARKRFSELSGGQKQRVLIARALATKPDVLVLDEPTAGVDAAATRTLSEFISQVHKERQLTTLWVTHDLSLVRKHAQYVLWLHEGKALYGAVEKLLSPENLSKIFEAEAS